MICVERDERSKRKAELAENPLDSLPAQMLTWKETKALYRLLDEPDVTFAALMQPHLQQTREQANGSPVVLLVQDTTDIDLSHRHKISGVGQIGNEGGRGFFVQTVLAVLPQSREVLGCIAQEPGCRAFPLLMENNVINGASGKSAKPMCGCARCRALGHLSQEACGCMSEIGVRICSPSAEACQATQTHFLVRAAQNRRLEESEEEISYSLMRARTFPSQASRPFEVPARHGHQARSTQLQLSFGQMTLLPPRNAPRASKEPLTVWVIRVWEEQAKDGRGAAGMASADLGPYHDARASLGAGGLVWVSLAGRGLSPMSQKWLSH